MSGIGIDLSIKEFDEPYPLPEKYADNLNDIFVVDQGDDLEAANEFVRRYGDRLISDQDRLFWRDDDYLFIDCPKKVKSCIFGTISRMRMYYRWNKNLCPYSSSSRHVEACVKQVLAHPGLKRPGFVKMLFKSSLGYIAFQNGVYCFKTQKLMSYPLDNVYFTKRINRDFRGKPDDKVLAELMERVIIPIFPVKEIRNYMLNRFARGLAGKIHDKIWHVCIGERNSGKGVMCILLENAFECFVQTINAENFLTKPSSNGDAAKSQSWLRGLEFKRLAISNEIQLGLGGKGRVDGNLIKRMASGGDEVQVRTNYQDEIQIRMQTTLFLCCNDFPPVEPVDAYQTLHSVDFATKFVPASEMSDRGSSCPLHWKVQDNDIKTWIHEEHVIDAFTWILLGAYGDGAIHDPPKSVKDFTYQFTEGANRAEIDKVGDILIYDTNEKSVVLMEEIKHAIKQANIGKISSQSLNKHILSLYGSKELVPKYKTMKKKLISGQTANGWGWTHLKIKEAAAYNEYEVNRANRLIRSELIRDSVNVNGKRPAENIEKGVPGDDRYVEGPECQRERWNAEARNRELHNELARNRLDGDHEEEMERRGIECQKRYKMENEEEETDDRVIDRSWDKEQEDDKRCEMVRASRNRQGQREASGSFSHGANSTPPLWAQSLPARVDAGDV